MDLQERFLNGVLLGNVFGRPQWQVLFIIMGCFSFATSQIRYSIPEELNKGALIGNIALDLGLDIKILRAGRARIVTGESVEYAELKADKGILVVKDRIDREHLCGDITPCSFSFEIILENPMELHQVTVEITDINDNSPVFEKKLINFEISESATIGSGFALERAFDPDVGINSLQNYVLTQNDYFILRQSPNPDGTKYVEMVLDKSLDREKKPNISLELMAVDGGNPPRSGSVNIYVTVLDANDNAPVFNQTVYRAFVMENAQKATHLITVKATDADSGTNGQILYSFSDIKEQFKDIFNINGESGAVTVVGKVDFEKDKRFEIRVKAIDRGGLTSTSKLIIEVIDVNDNAPVISVMSLSSPISEHSLPGTTIAIINVKDADSGRNGQVTCSIEKKLPFSIKSSLSNYYNLITDASLDRESKSEYNITVIVTDSGSPALSSSTLLHLKVSDINDNSPMFDQKSYSAQVPENNSPGLSVCIVTAKDLDWKQNSKVSYFLEDAHIGAASISSFISVNLESGVVQAVRSFDYEQIKQLQFVVRAQDGGSPPLSSNVTVKIKIQDQNDNAPQILYPVQSGASVVAEIVPRSADVGYLVTKVVAVDIDSGQNAWLSYKLQKATDRALFEVGAQNGEIRTVRQVTDKDAVKQRLSVVVEDNGQPPRSATVNVNVALADSFPELLSEFSDFTLHDKERNDNLTFYLVLALAVVLFLFIVSIIAILSVKCYRWRRERMFSKSGANLPVIPYYPPLYADIGGAGTSRHVYNYEVCRTADSRKSDLKYAKPCSESVISLDYSGTQTLAHGQRETLRHKEIKDQQKPPSSDWRFPPNQRPGPSGAAATPEVAVGTGPWPNPPSEAEQLQALMAAANEVSEATNTLTPGTMGLSTRYNPQFTLQHVPDYRQNVYIPGSTATLTPGQQQAPPTLLQQAPPPMQASAQPEPPKAQTPASKKKSTKKDKK